jgi:hypothetical protein
MLDPFRPELFGEDVERSTSKIIHDNFIEIRRRGAKTQCYHRQLGHGMANG